MHLDIRITLDTNGKPCEVCLLPDAPPAISEKVVLEWHRTKLGGYWLGLPGSEEPIYNAQQSYEFASSYQEQGAKFERRVHGGTMRERAEQLALWARMDGYEVPPIPED